MAQWYILFNGKVALDQMLALLGQTQDDVSPKDETDRGDVAKVADSLQRRLPHGLSTLQLHSCRATSASKHPHDGQCPPFRLQPIPSGQESVADFTKRFSIWSIALLRQCATVV
jgi:hypothetical protein